MIKVVTRNSDYIHILALPLVFLCNGVPIHLARQCILHGKHELISIMVNDLWKIIKQYSNRYNYEIVPILTYL